MGKGTLQTSVVVLALKLGQILKADKIPRSLVYHSYFYCLYNLRVPDTINTSANDFLHNYLDIETTIDACKNDTIMT